MESTSQHTVGDVAEQLLADSLIDACELHKDRVVIVQNSNRHTFPYEQARAFMKGMLRGRTWSSASLARHAGNGAYHAESDESHWPVKRQTERALDELACTAESLELIQSHELIGDGKVKIALTSCETELYEEEAIAFLADCILHKLNAMLGEARLSAPIHSGAWSRDRRTQPALPGN